MRRDEFRSRLDALAGRVRQQRHPWLALLGAGRLGHGDLRLWVANHLHHLGSVAIADALIVDKARAPPFRQLRVPRRLAARADREWPVRARRTQPEIELWRRLGVALGLGNRELESSSALLPVVRAVCEESTACIRDADLLTAVAYSSSEHFSPALPTALIEARQYYPFLPESVVAGFRELAARARADVAIDYLCRHAHTSDERRRCLDAVEHSFGISWRLLDAVYVACRRLCVPRLSRDACLVKLSSLASAIERERGTAPAALMVRGCPLLLNRTGYDLVESCDGQLRLQDVIRQLSHRHRAAPDAVERDVARFVAELERRHILLFEGGSA